MSLAFWSVELSGSAEPKTVQPPIGYVLNLQIVSIIYL